MMAKVLEWLINNWSVVVAIIALIVAAIVWVVKFLKLPTDKQVKKIKECLLAWVIDAEIELGGGTGIAKLSKVYGWFVTAFPIVKNFVSYDTFNTWVKEALVIMEKMLKENENFRKIVEGNILVVEEAVTPLISTEVESENQ